MAVAPFQVLQLLAHRVKHRIVLVHQSVSNLETTLSALSLVCLVLRGLGVLALDLFTQKPFAQHLRARWLGVQRDHSCFDGQGSRRCQHGAGANPGQQFRQNQKTRRDHHWFRNPLRTALALV